MREEFPRKKIGDSLSARHVNEMSDVARRFGRMTPGSYLRGVHTRHYVSLSGLEPFQQFTFLIASDEGDGLYKGRIRWYDTDNTDWEPDASDLDDESASYDPEEWNIDAGNIGIGLSVGDYVICYWDQQRGMFVPVGNSSFVVGFTLTEDMGETAAGEASATIHKTWDSATESYTGNEDGVVKDTRSIFGAATSGSTGLGLLRQGDGREIVDPYNMSCP